MITQINIIKPTAEMEAVFERRSEQHRMLVRKNLLLLQDYLQLPLALLMQTAEQHDQSKFLEPERTAYTWMTWKYYCHAQGLVFEYPDVIAPLVLQGWQHHLHTNQHHPEAHSHPDAMDDLAIVEMVCDWTAISQEQKLNQGSCLVWAQANIDKKWQFSPAKKALIWATIHELDKRSRDCQIND